MEYSRDRLLPLGSIVALRGTEKKVMIVSRAVGVSQQGGTVYFEYAACGYPEGVTGDKLLFFDTGQIAEIMFLGFENEENAFRHVYTVNEDELWAADNYKSNQDAVQNSIYSDVGQTETIDKYLICTNMVIGMLRDCYNLCVQAEDTFKEIGETLQELDETTHITLHGDNAYYESGGKT